MLSKDGMSQLIQQAQRMQEQVEALQTAVAQQKVVGESGAGLVKVILNGAYVCHRVTIDESLLQNDKEILEDLLAAAFNDAVGRIEQLQKEQMEQQSHALPTRPLDFKLS